MRCAKRARVNAPARQPDHAASSAAAMNNAALRDRLCQHLAACRHAARAGRDRRDPARLAPQRRSRDHRRATRDRSSLRSSARRRARCDRGYLSPYRSRSAPHRHDAPSRQRYRRTRVPGMVDGVHRQSQSAAEAVALVTRSLSSSNAMRLPAPGDLHKPGDRGRSASARGGSPPSDSLYGRKRAQPSPAAAENPSSAINFHSAFSAAASFASSTLRSTM